MGGRIQPRESENTYLYICSQYVHTQQVWYTAPVGMLQLGSWKGQNSTTDPFCP